jgi:hypothetical protein
MPNKEENITIKHFNNKDGKFYRFRSLEDWSDEQLESEMEDIKTDALTFVNPKLFNDAYEMQLDKLENEFSPILKSLFHQVFTACYNWVASMADEMESMKRELLGNLEVDGKGTLVSTPEMTTENIVKAYDILINDLTGEKLLVKMIPLRYWGVFIHLFQTLMTDRSHIKLCCFTKQLKSQRYFAHYAGSHSGFAIEYLFDSNYNDLTGMNYPLPVTYARYVSDIPKPSRHDEYFISPILLKDKEWEREEEFRMFVPSNNKTHPNFKKIEMHPKISTIKAIHLGSRFDKTSKNGKRLLEVITNKKDIKIYKMQKNNQSPTLNPVEFEV